MNIDKNKFCVVPFVQLNTRGKGDARVCCSISGIDYGIPKKLKLDELDKENYNSSTEVYNLANDSIESMWNGVFMKDFRMKMLNGEDIPNCEFCHRMESSGFGSKRLGKNKKFFEKARPHLEKYYKENGHVNIVPQWWEIRLSTKCNLSCVMCSPNLSSMMYKEYSKWEPMLTNEMRGSLQIAKESGEEYLSESKFFKDQILNSLKDILFIELRGGEFFADKPAVEFVKSISKSEYAKKIQLDISTNGTLITPDIVEMLNRFEGGLLRFSIDAYKEKDELIRYHTKWNSVLASVENSTKLHSNWSVVTQTCMQTLNCIGINELLWFLDEYCDENKNFNFNLGFTMVRGKEHMRLELIPLEQRMKEITLLELFIRDSFLCNERPQSRKAVEGLISALSKPTLDDSNLRKRGREYYLKLNDLRNVDYWKVFPHLEYLDV